jgi:hypothetical protein
MVQQLDQDSQPFAAGKFLVKLAVGFFCLGQSAEFAYGLLHNKL